MIQVGGGFRGMRWGIVVAVALLSGVVVRAEDWPQFRGPNRDGVWHEGGILRSFPAGGLKVRWRQPVGVGWSSPVVAQGRVFVTDALLQKPLVKERVHCFEEATGKALWTYAYDVTYSEWVWVPSQTSGPTATPIVEAGRVYALGANGHVHCLDAQTGRVIWQNDLGKQYQILVQQCRPSPLIEGNLLIVSIGAKPGASVIALDKGTGKEIWKALNDPVSNSSPVVVEVGGKRQLIVWTDESVASLNPKTGETFWHIPMVTSHNDSIPTPVVQKNRLLISGLMLTLDEDRPAASILWPEARGASKRILSNTSTPLLQGDYVYSARSSGELVCLDAHTGQQLWRNDTVTDLKRGASIHLTPNDDVVFLFTDKGDLILAKLRPEGYREISRAHLLEPTSPMDDSKCAWSPPAYADRCVFARNDVELVCVSLADTR
jgi:outer membrane protein assembly factor BamB